MPENSAPDKDLAVARASALVEHYQMTYELVLRFWERRNRQFLILIGVLAVAALATIFQKPLLNAAETYMRTTVPDVIASLPLAYKVLVTLLLVGIFYLMANLYHRSSMIMNWYLYLGIMETRIQEELRLGVGSVPFSREGRFYAATASRTARWVGASYKLILGTLILFFFVSRIVFDRPGEWLPLRVSAAADLIRWYEWLIGNFLFVVDVLIVLPTVLLFWMYARLRPPTEDRLRREMQRLQTEYEQRESDPSATRAPRASA